MSYLDELRNDIVEIVRNNDNLDGVDISTRLHIPIDVVYNEIDVLIEEGTLRRIYFGIQSRLEVIDR